MNVSLPRFSPDGEWIAYYRRAQGGPQNHSFGLYIMPSSCLSTPAIWEQNSVGPYPSDAVFAWSPIGSNMVTNVNGHIQIYTIEERTLKQIREFDSLASLCTVSWSPTGEEIIFTADNLSKLSLKTKSVVTIQTDMKDACIVNWVTIP